MKGSPEILTDAGNVHTYVLEWIARCRPDFLLPVSCKTEGSTARISFHTEGLLTLAEYSGMCIKEQAQPAEWIIHVLEAIRDILAKSDDHLLNRSLFLLNIHSVWYKIPSRMANAEAVCANKLTPILTCLPAAGTLSEGDLASIAIGLLEIAEKAMPPDHTDSDLLRLQTAARHGADALCDHLDNLASQRMHPDETVELQINSVDSNSDRFPSSDKKIRLTVFVAWFVLTMVLATIPLTLRYGPEPFRIFQNGTEIGYHRLVSAVLGVMAIADILLLFAPFSPFHISARKGYVNSAQKNKYRIRSLKQEIRMSGLLTVIASRLGKDGCLGAPTSQVAVSPGSERLGFLSEGEPGTLSEAQGIRAYLLTEEFLVGRDPDMADLAVPDASIGRVHARINRIEGVFFLTDLGSVNGTRLDGRRLDRHVQTALPDKCRISFAERTFYFIAD